MELGMDIELIHVLILTAALAVIGGLIVTIILLLIEGALYLWEWNWSRGIDKYLARKRIK